MNTERKRIRLAIKNEEQKLENIYQAIENGVIKKGNIDERIEKIKANISLLEQKLNEIENIRTLPTFRFLSTTFLQKLQQKLKEIFYQDSSFAKRYLGSMSKPVVKISWVPTPTLFSLHKALDFSYQSLFSLKVLPLRYNLPPYHWSFLR